MVKASYEQLIAYIIKHAALSKEEVERRIHAKKAKLSGLISNEGAAQVVAAELGISFEKIKLKINEFIIGMKKIHVLGKVLEIYPIRSYKRKDHEGEVATLLLADDTGNTRVVLWDTHHIELIKNNTIQKNSFIEIKNADVRGTLNKELHLGSNSEISLTDKQIQNIITARQKPPTQKIEQLDPSKNIQTTIRATIVQMFQPAFFYVCPECNQKVSYEQEKAICAKHSIVVPKKRALISLVLDDGTDNIRSVIFSEQIEKLFELAPEEIEKLSDSQFLIKKKSELLGEELIFSGRTRKNMLFNNTEFIIQDVEKILPQDLIQKLSG